MIEKLIEKINRIEDEDRVNEFIIFTSLDGWGKKAEYQRFGLDFNLFWDNLNLILEKCPRVNATIMATYNALSVSSYDKVIKGVYDLKTQYGSDDRYWNSAVFLDSSYLRFPLHQTVQVLPKEMSNLIYKQAQLTEYMATPNFETRLIGYSDIEVQKIRRIYDWMLATDEEKIISQRQDFYRFFKEHDKRRGTNFKKTFPELADFYEDCKKLC